MLPTVSQIDLVPTLSLLLDQPIPFPNLGTIIPDFFDGKEEMFIPKIFKQISDAKIAGNAFKQINKVYLALINSKQILRYIDQYQTFSNELPSDLIEVAKANFEFSVDKFDELLQILVGVDWENETLVTIRSKEISGYIQDMQLLDRSFQDILQSIKSMCRKVWAQFELFPMCLGLSLMGFISVTVFIMLYSMNIKLVVGSGILHTLICVIGFFFSLIGVAYLAVPFQNVKMAAFVVFAAISFSFSLWLLACGSNIFILKVNNLKFNFSVLIQQHGGIGWIFLAYFIVHSTSLFSNSFIIYEDMSTMFLFQSMVLFYAIKYFITSLKYYKIQNVKSLKSKSYMQMKTVIIQFCFNEQTLKLSIIVAVLLICIRSTKGFWFCREMQLTCVVSTYSLPLAALITTFTERYAQERLLLAFFSLFSLLVITRWYLKRRGNLNGFSSTVIVMKILAVLCVVFMVLHWILQLALSHPMSVAFNILYLQQILFPRIVYICFILSVILLVTSPLAVTVVFRNHQDLHQNKTIPELFNELKDTISKRLLNNTSEVPLVYGLQTVYSSAFIVLVFILTVVTCLVLSDSMVFPVLLLWISSYCIMGLFSLSAIKGPCEYGEV